MFERYEGTGATPRQGGAGDYLATGSGRQSPARPGRPARVGVTGAVAATRRPLSIAQGVAGCEVGFVGPVSTAAGTRPASYGQVTPGCGLAGRAGVGRAAQSVPSRPHEVSMTSANPQRGGAPGRRAAAVGSSRCTASSTCCLLRRRRRGADPAGRCDRAVRARADHLINADLFTCGIASIISRSVLEGRVAAAAAQA